jgi:hypothetical protein
MNGLAPHYLRELIPEHAYQWHNYNTRNAEERITPYICRTASLARSFIPQTIKDCNSLDAIIREKPILNSFKNALSNIPEFNTERPPDCFNIGPRIENITLARLRNKCSALASDLHINHVVGNSICTNCNTLVPETADHYFLQCPRFNNPRYSLIVNTSFTIRNGNLRLTADLILHGYDILSQAETSTITKAAITLQPPNVFLQPFCQYSHLHPMPL